jgi:hypothetical protein
VLFPLQKTAKNRGDYARYFRLKEGANRLQTGAFLERVRVPQLWHQVAPQAMGGAFANPVQPQNS